MRHLAADPWNLIRIMPAQGVQKAHLCRSGGGAFVYDRLGSPGRAVHALIVADGDVPARAGLDAAWPDWAAGTGLVLAADGGWEKARRLGLKPEVLVGDMDSLPPAALSEAEALGVEIERSPAAKDESDAELALLAALRRGATRVTVLGALGGKRFDHALANLGLLALPAPGTADVVLLDGTTRIRLLRAPAPGGGAARCPLPGVAGDLVSLIPFGLAAEGVTTEGLAYPLRDETLPPGPARGLSNVRTSPDASVRLRSGALLVVETRPLERSIEGEPS